MKAIGPGCHELRVIDTDVIWRIVYGLASDAVVILDVFAKKTKATPRNVIENSRRRWQKYLHDVEDE